MCTNCEVLRDKLRLEDNRGRKGHADNNIRMQATRQTWHYILV